MGVEGEFIPHWLAPRSHKVSTVCHAAHSTGKLQQAIKCDDVLRVGRSDCSPRSDFCQRLFNIACKFLPRASLL